MHYEYVFFAFMFHYAFNPPNILIYHSEAYIDYILECVCTVYIALPFTGQNLVMFPSLLKVSPSLLHSCRLIQYII